MRNFKITFLLTAMLISVTACKLAAQTRPQRTSSAKAYYGHSPEKPKYKMKKKHKVHKYGRIKPAKGTRADGGSASYRRRSYPL